MRQVVQTYAFVWLLALALVTAAGMAMADTPSGGVSPTSGTAADAGAASASGQMNIGATDAVDASGAASGSESGGADASTKAILAYASGLAPLPNDQQIPEKWLPPGADAPDTGPSPVIYPIQKVTLRFNHKLHTQQGSQCKGCHAGAYSSESVNDSLTPKGSTCDSCHGTDHSNLAKVTPGDDEMGTCQFCHVGYKPSDGNAVAALELPRANMAFNHKKHVQKNIGCAQCHGAVQELELATRDQLPRMKGCFDCHQQSDSAARGTAKSACETCHLREPAGSNLTSTLPNEIAAAGGRIKVLFASGELLPPRWLHNAAHTPDFIERHKMVAANDSQFCANCHKEDFCTNCHDGRVRPRSIHPNDYISMHPIEARQATQKCQSCHREQTFCVGCHMRVGVAEGSPTNARMSGRFHPPKDIWSDAPRKPGHHAFEAERNVNACVSCHTERDCVSCHGAQGVGGGFNPHNAGFQGRCASQMRRNPRPCFVCHQPGDAVLASCR